MKALRLEFVPYFEMCISLALTIFLQLLLGMPMLGDVMLFLGDVENTRVWQNKEIPEPHNLEARSISAPWPKTQSPRT